MMRLAFAFLLLTSTALAGETQDLGEDISLEDWRKMAMGKTLTYKIGPDFFALERYATSGNRVDLQLNTGECLAGTWSHSNNTYCFDWGDTRAACFRHIRNGDTILIVQMDNGQETTNIQQMTNVSDAPLNCGQHMS